MSTNHLISNDILNIQKIVNGDHFRNKRILVSGGAGFIGSWICDVLINFDAFVTVVDDFSTGLKSNIAHLLEHKTFKLSECDIQNFKSADKYDFIFHLAAHASPEEYQLRPIKTLEANSLGTFNIAKIAMNCGARLLFASTSEVYGDTTVIPTPETYWGNVNSVGIRSCYDESKRFSEALLMAYSRQCDLDIRLPRIFNTYGPRLREDGFYGRALSRFALQALTDQPLTVYGDGSQTRSFSYVTDTVTGLLLLMIEPKAKNEVVNVGNNFEISILALANKIKEITNNNHPITFLPLPKDDPRRRQPDITKLVEITNWIPQVDFEVGLERTIDWLRVKLQNVKE